MKHFPASRLLWCALVAAAATLPAAAQGDRVRPPAPEEEPSGAPISTWGTVILTSTLVIGASALKSRRGHQA